jgi:hypothetical protein
VLRSTCAFSAVILFAMILSGCGGSTPSAPSGVHQESPTDQSPAPVVPVPPVSPTTWAIKGRIVAAPDGDPVSDASVKFGDADPVRSDSEGNYTIITTDSTTKPLVVEAAGFQRRETFLRGGEARSGVAIDLIGNDPVFPFSLYTMMARNGFEAPVSVRVAPTKPWAYAPSVYIWTMWKDSGQPVNPDGVLFLINEIRRVIPQLTGGRFNVDRIETGRVERPAAKGWINVQFHRSGNWGYVGADPGTVQFGGDHTCNSYAIIHEFGHAMGYWHSNVRPSVMGGGPGTCTEINMTADEQKAARVMYSRPPGNVQPDRDPAPFSLLSAPIEPVIAVDCDRLSRR